jgi:hypothetical protein
MLDAGNSLEDDLSCYSIAQNLEKLCGDSPLFKSPAPELALGDYSLGEIAGTDEPLTFGLREDELIKHIIIAGSSGTGKTNVAFILVKQFLNKDKPFMVFDWKRNFRDCVNFPEARHEILIFTVGRELCAFHFNPLIPPSGTSPSVWLGKLIEIMAHAFFLGEGVIYILSKALDSVYSQFGVYGNSGRWPTFRDVLNYLEGYESRGRETQWVASALRSVSMLCFGELDRILNVGHYPIDKLLERNVILELDALTDTAKIFLTESLLLWIHHYRMAQGKREQFKHACIIEEAHHILSRKLQMISGTETVTDMILREVREFGESLVIVDQDPSLLSVPAIGNTYTTICMSLKERNDVNLMAACLNLDYNEKDILTKLPVGQAVVKLQGRCPDPFLLSIPKVEVEKGRVTDAQVSERMAWFYRELQENTPKTDSMKETAGTSTRSRKRVERKEELENEDNRRKKAGDAEKQGREQENKKIVEDRQPETEGLGNVAIELLVDICQNPLSKIGDRYKRLGMDEARGNRVRQLLESRGLIEAVSLPSLESRGYWGKALELTENGRAALVSLRQLKLPDEISKRKGGLLHRHYLKLIGERLQQAGCEVAYEHSLGNGEATDLLVNGQIAVEFERSDRNTLQNVRKNLKKGFRVIVVAETPALKERIFDLLVESGLQGSVGLVELRNFSEAAVARLIPSLFSSSSAPTQLSARKRPHFQEKAGKRE